MINFRVCYKAEQIKTPQTVKQEIGPQIVADALQAMNDMVELHRDDDAFSLYHVIASLNADQYRIFQHIKTHLEHQAHHESKPCNCTNLIPLHLFMSGVGGTGKSFLIKTIQVQVSAIWPEKQHSLLCGAAPTGLAAFNVGGVTIHRLFQLPTEHEGKTATYWPLSKDALKVLRNTLSQKRLLIIDEVSMVSNLTLVYIHLRIQEIFVTVYICINQTLGAFYHY